jgi:hypothetical protein
MSHSPYAFTQGVTSLTGAATIKVNAASGAITLTDVGVTAVNAGTGVTVSATTGSVTVTNAGVTAFNGSTGAVLGVGSITAGNGITVSASTGSVTITNADYGPVWSVYPSTQAQSIPTGAQKILFQAKEFDTASVYNTTTNRLVPGAGYFQMNAGFSSTSTLGVGTLFLMIYKNGSEYRRGERVYTNGQAAGCQINTTAYSTATDYFEVYVNNSTGGTINAEPNGPNVYGPWFNGSMVRGL